MLISPPSLASGNRTAKPKVSLTNLDFNLEKALLPRPPFSQLGEELRQTESRQFMDPQNLGISAKSVSLRNEVHRSLTTGEAGRQVGSIEPTNVLNEYTPIHGHGQGTCHAPRNRATQGCCQGPCSPKDSRSSTNMGPPPPPELSTQNQRTLGTGAGILDTRQAQVAGVASLPQKETFTSKNINHLSSLSPLNFLGPSN